MITWCHEAKKQKKQQKSPASETKFKYTFSGNLWPSPVPASYNSEWKNTETQQLKFILVTVNHNLNETILLWECTSFQYEAQSTDYLPSVALVKSQIWSVNTFEICGKLKTCPLPVILHVNMEIHLCEPEYMNQVKCPWSMNFGFFLVFGYEWY